MNNTPAPRKKTTNIHRVLEALTEKDQSSQEIALNLGIPPSTARSTISFLTRAGMTEPVPAEKKGKPFKITDAGRNLLKELKAAPDVS